MSIRAQCPQCGRAGSVPDGSLGRQGKCPACGATFTITRPTGAGPYAVSPPSARPTPDARPAPPPHQAAAASHNQTVVYVSQGKSNGLGVAGFVCSLIGLLTCGCLSPLGLALSVAGLSTEPRGLAIAGAIIGGVGTIPLVVAFVLLLLRVIATPL